jgi:hypothetical protein
MEGGRKIISIFFVNVNNPPPAGDVNIYVNKKSLFPFGGQASPCADVNIYVFHLDGGSVTVTVTVTVTIHNFQTFCNVNIDIPRRG